MTLVRYLSSIPGLVYLSQLAVFIIALVASYFKLVQEDADGKQIRSRFGIPRPTRAGKTALAVLIASLIFSLLLTFGNAEKNDEAEVKAKAAQTKLETQLDRVRQENSRLNEQLQTLTIKKFSELFADQSSKHTQYLDRFRALLREQEINEQRTAVGINRLLTPITSDAELSFLVEIPGNQPAVDTLARRLESEGRILVSERLLPSDGSFPTDREFQLKNFLGLTDIHARFFKKAVDLRELTKAPQDNPGGFSVERSSQPTGLDIYAQLNLEQILRNSSDAKPLINLEIDTSDIDRSKYLWLDVSGLRPQRADTTITTGSFLDLAGFYVMVDFPIWSRSEINFRLKALAIRSRTGRTLRIERFDSYYKYTHVYFIGKVE